MLSEACTSTVLRASGRNARLAELGRQMVAGEVRLRLDALRASERLSIAASFPDLPQCCPRISYLSGARVYPFTVALQHA